MSSKHKAVPTKSTRQKEFIEYKISDNHGHIKVQRKQKQTRTSKAVASSISKSC